MKTKIEINSDVSLDVITYQLQENLSTNDLVNFAIQIGDNFTEQEEYYTLLQKRLIKICASIELSRLK